MDMWRVFLQKGTNSLPIQLPSSVDMSGSAIVPAKDARIMFESKLYDVVVCLWDYDKFEITIFVK